MAGIPGMGTQVRDALEPALETGITLDAAATENGDAVEVMRPRRCRVELKTATVASTGDSATLSVEIQSSDSSTFASGNVSHGRFALLDDTDANLSDLTRYLDVYVTKRYMRAVFVIGGTAPDFTGTTCRVVETNLERTDDDSA